jgi:hypothetical protein
MWKVIKVRCMAAFSVLAVLFSTLLISSIASAQQWVIADKDRTRPAQSIQYDIPPATFTSFGISRNDGYNEVRWSTINESGANKFIIEYSLNGADYSEAAQVIPTNKPYLVKHYTTDNSPMLYRIKTEYLDGKFSYSAPVMLDGIARSPVTVYPTIVETNKININASWPIEQINIFTQSGIQVFTKAINGQSGFIPLNLTKLSKGMYLMSFQGNGWQTTSKFLVP